jgi:hypothetical protein
MRSKLIIWRWLRRQSRIWIAVRPHGSASDICPRRPTHRIRDGSRGVRGGTTIIGTPHSHWPYSSRQQCCVTPGKQEPWADHRATVAVRGRLRPALQRHLHAGLQDTTQGALCTWNRRAPATARMSWPHAMCGFIRRPMSDVEFHTPASGWRTKGSAQRVGSW